MANNFSITSPNCVATWIALSNGNFALTWFILHRTWAPSFGGIESHLPLLLSFFLFVNLHKPGPPLRVRSDSETHAHPSRSKSARHQRIVGKVQSIRQKLSIMRMFRLRCVCKSITLKYRAFMCKKFKSSGIGEQCETAVAELLRWIRKSFEMRRRQVAANEFFLRWTRRTGWRPKYLGGRLVDWEF